VSTKKKILLIDDNNDILDMLEIFLFKHYDVITAVNGFEALKKAEEEKPDGIITDILMPVMDGIKFYNTLKKNPAIAKIPVIAITSFLKKNSLKSLLSIGFADVISKPFNLGDILETVKKTLEKPVENEK
jgi:CheY-like chemotaxis protein